MNATIWRLWCGLLFGLIGIASTNALQAQTTNLVEADSIKIGIIGTGNIGGALARHWANAGHEVLMSSRHPLAVGNLSAQELRARINDVL